MEWKFVIFRQFGDYNVWCIYIFRHCLNYVLGEEQHCVCVITQLFSTVNL